MSPIIFHTIYLTVISLSLIYSCWSFIRTKKINHSILVALFFVLVLIWGFMLYHIPVEVLYASMTHNENTFFVVCIAGVILSIFLNSGKSLDNKRELLYSPGEIILFGVILTFILYGLNEIAKELRFKELDSIPIEYVGLYSDDHYKIDVQRKKIIIEFDDEIEEVKISKLYFTVGKTVLLNDDIHFNFKIDNDSFLLIDYTYDSTDPNILSK